MRALLALALLTLAACGQPAATSTATPAAGQPGQVHLSVPDGLPDWLLVANDHDCFDGPPSQCQAHIFYNQRTVTRGADGTADIWVQIQHARPQHYVAETNTTRTSVEFTTERYHYRFKCAEDKFTVVERNIMGANDVRLFSEPYPEIYRTPVDGSAVPLLEPIACRGA